MIQATNGDLYGTTKYGGTNGDGTVFKITLNGTLTTLHNFYGTDGYYPVAALTQARTGNVYGTTYAGGANGYGTIFVIAPNGTLTTLYSFCPEGGFCTDGENPEGGLIQATDGYLSGTTSLGGIHYNGTVFKFLNGTLTTVHSFGVKDGSEPFAGLLQVTDGNLYGTTFESGADLGGGALGGTIFEIHHSATVPARSAGSSAN